MNGATLQKAKGPASAATDPDHGSNNPSKGKAMNVQSDNTTPAVRAMVPYAGHTAIDEMDRALGRLRILRVACAAAAAGISDVSDFDMEASLTDIIDEIDPIRAFLAENDFDDRRVSFFECRREWFERKGGSE